MKKKSFTNSAAIIIVALLVSVKLLAQNSSPSWSVAGNSNATSSSKLGTTNLVPLKFFTNNSQRMIVDSLGRVGIGITKPVNIFTVKSGGGTPAASWLTGLNTPVFIGFADDMSSEQVLAAASHVPAERAVFQGRRSRGTLAAPAAVANNDYITSLLASAYDGSTFQNPALVSFFVDGTPSSGNVPTRISLVTGSNAGNRTERLKVGSTGNFDFNNGQVYLQQSSGNVGIGTTTPTYPLDLRGSSSTTQIRLSYPSNGGPYFASIGFSDPNQGLSDVCARMDMGFESLSQNSNSYVAFRTGQSGFAGNNDISTERMRITSSGNVGIGTTSPVARLEIENTTDAHGISVVNSFAGNDNLIGVYAYSKPADGYGYGVTGRGGFEGGHFGGEGGSYSGTVSGVAGFAVGSAGTRYGVFGLASGGTINYAGYFNGSVYATDSYLPSARKLKTGIASLTGALAQLLKLKPSTYQYKTAEYKDMALPEGTQMGLIAEEVKEVFPQLVKAAVHPAKYSEDRKTVLSPEVRFDAVNYQGLIPLLVASVQELNKKNKELEARLQKLEALLTKGSNNTSVTVSGAYLEQISPNPARGTTTIRYGVPEGEAAAKLTLVNSKGQVLKAVSINGKGAGQLNLNTASLPSGTYTCTLWVDGSVADSRQMVIVH